MNESNYNINVTQGKLTVDKANLNITVDADAKITYGSTGEFTDTGYTANGLVNSDDKSVLGDSFTYTSSKYDANKGSRDTANAGTYDDLSISGLDESNYNINVTDGKLTVDKAVLNVTVNDANITYGSTGEFTGTGYDVTSGLVNGDKKADLEDSVQYTSSQYDTNKNGRDTANAGTYNDLSISGLNDANYNITVNKGKLKVNKADLNLTAKDYAIIYGDKFDANKQGYIIDQTNKLVNGDTESVLTGKVNYTNGAYTDASHTKTQDASSTGYDLTIDTFTLDNYKVTRGAGTVTIKKATLVAKVDPAEIRLNSGLPHFTGSLEGLVNEDAESTFGGLTFSTAADGTKIGTYAVNGKLGNDDWVTNYTFTDAAGNATAFVVSGYDTMDDELYKAALRHLQTEGEPGQKLVRKALSEHKEKEQLVIIENRGLKL